MCAHWPDLAFAHSAAAVGDLNLQQIAASQEPSPLTCWAKKRAFLMQYVDLKGEEHMSKSLND